jgi:endonuclease YncB( thermonuclease family)
MIISSKIAFAFIALAFLRLQASSGFAWEARVVKVADGDTITVEPKTDGQRGFFIGDIYAMVKP